MVGHSGGESQKKLHLVRLSTGKRETERKKYKEGETSRRREQRSHSPRGGVQPRGDRETDAERRVHFRSGGTAEARRGQKIYTRPSSGAQREKVKSYREAGDGNCVKGRKKEFPRFFARPARAEPGGSGAVGDEGGIGGRKGRCRMGGCE